MSATPERCEKMRVCYMAQKERIKAQVRAGRRTRLRHNRTYILRQVNGACQKCGYKQHPEILQFDHIVPIKNWNTRRFSDILSRLSITNPRLWDEFALVQVLCPNCHALKTIEDRANGWQ